MRAHLTSCLAFVGLAATSTGLAAQESELNFRFGIDYWGARTQVEQSKETIHQDSVEARVPFYLAIEHNYPYVPNFRVRYTPVEGEYIEYNKYDYTLYYDIIEHDLMHFDIGATWSTYADGDYRNPAQTERTFTKRIFSWHANAEINVPNSDFSIIGEFDFANRSGNKTADLTAGVRYDFDIEKFDAAIRGGYRATEYKFDFMADNDFYLTHGFFIGVELGL
ncbi:TIGR04219 family outer membrane beta-barrel protein [Vibrio sp. SCSIO 43136]|uniref:TIGR04219 family outer membrane beta-barrel protein n=1 Tax=Vibrio sp. SCSIO 43136 TaxID=2819101 RepID=UPI0020760792|nr:TIGR04219 family outer membrane beta-barrel protein [Vibrio sp. SCSIO 43136]USD65040.1 TIGR04219 family outer membrane beta-barrel protein [Vibrio sp. SCSIO 43136]